MRVITELLERRPDKPLFHYTTAAGLLGILQENSIWASSAYHLNDTSEFRFALDLIRRRLDMRMQAATPSDDLIYTQLWRTLRDVQQRLQVCIASFSEEGDLLSQWLAYSGTNGYAIGIEDENFSEARKSGFSLVPCIYREDEQIRAAEAFIDAVVDRSEDRDEQIAAKALTVAAAIKHPGFEREAEWRLVKVLSHQLNPVKFSHRLGRNGIVPFQRAPLSTSSSLLYPKTIYIGPNSDMDSAVLALEGLMVERLRPEALMEPRKNFTKVIRSNTPYRP